MRETLQQLWDDAHHSFLLLERLRDEILVELHLAGMDARTRWHEELEPRFRGAEAALAKLEVSARDSIQDLLRDYRLFKELVAMERPHAMARAPDRPSADTRKEPPAKRRKHRSA